MIKTLKNLLKQDKDRYTVPRKVQDVIPIRRIWKDGIFQVGSRFSKTYQFTDINYLVASREDKEQMFLAYSELLNSLDSGATTKITINNRRLNRANFEQSILMPMRGDACDVYRREYNQMLLDKATGANGIIQEKYITVSVCKKDIEEARTYFARIGADLIAHFAALGSKCTELDAAEKLRVLHDFYRQGEEAAFHFDPQDMMRKGHDFKDYICPDSMEKSSDCLKLGEKYCRVLFLKDYASYIKDSMVTELTNFNRNMMLSIDVVPIPTDEAVREVENRLLGIETNITNWQRRQNANNNFSAVVPYDMELQRKESKEFLDDLTTRDQRMMLAVITMVITADDKKQLDSDTETVLAVARKHTKTERAYIELNLAHLSHNAAALQAAMPQGCELMAVVKTEAYGHGAYEVSTCLEKDGVKAFAVATIDEGIRLRCYGIRGDILILGFTDVHRARELKKYRLTQTLIDAAYAECLNQQGTPVRVHIGIDSGMHRLGFDADDFENIRQVFRMKNLKVDGMFTHLCCCESLEPEDVAFTKNQICRFYALIDYLKEHKVPIPKLHIQSSYGLLNYPELKCDYVREGISLYGVASTPQDKTTLQLDLRPVLALKAKVILIRDVPQGDFVGYDRAYQTERDSKIAILPIGYGDGFPRNLSCGKASVKIGTYIVPIIGRICMDQLAIDITDTEGVAVGDTATLIDNQENSLLSTPCVAERSDSISNEILSRMGARLPIVIKE